MLLKTETCATFVNGLLGFITLGIYTLLEARVYCSHTKGVAHRYVNLSALLINILLGSFQLFLYSDQFLFWRVKIAQRVSASRGGCIIHAGGGGHAFGLDRLL